jgi:hypothetical protein
MKQISNNEIPTNKIRAEGFKNVVQNKNSDFVKNILSLKIQNSLKDKYVSCKEAKDMNRYFKTYNYTPSSCKKRNNLVNNYKHAVTRLSSNANNTVPKLISRLLKSSNIKSPKKIMIVKDSADKSNDKRYITPAQYFDYAKTSNPNKNPNITFICLTLKRRLLSEPYFEDGKEYMVYRQCSGSGLTGNFHLFVLIPVTLKNKIKEGVSTISQKLCKYSIRYDNFNAQEVNAMSINHYDEIKSEQQYYVFDSKKPFKYTKKSTLSEKLLRADFKRLGDYFQLKLVSEINKNNQQNELLFLLTKDKSLFLIAYKEEKGHYIIYKKESEPEGYLILYKSKLVHGNHINNLNNVSQNTQLKKIQELENDTSLLPSYNSARMNKTGIHTRNEATSKRTYRNRNSSNNRNIKRVKR